MDVYLVVPRFFLFVSAVIHVYFGITFFIDPLIWMVDLSLDVTSDAGLTELITVYGGVMTSLGCFFLFAAMWPRFVESGLWVMGITYGGAVFGRSVGIFWHQAYDPFILDVYAVEIGGFVCTLVGAWMLRSYRQRVQ